MAIDRTGISSLDTGASDITYSGDEGPKSPQEEMQIAGGEYNRVLEILEKVRENIPLSEEEKIELQGLIKTLTAKGIDVRQLIGQEQGREGIQMASAADPMLQDEYDKYVFDIQEQGGTPMTIEEFRQQAVAGLATGGRAGYRGGQLVKPGPGRPGYQGWSPGVVAEEREQRAREQMRGPIGRDPVVNIPTAAPSLGVSVHGGKQVEDINFDLLEEIRRQKEEKIDTSPEEENWFKKQFDSRSKFAYNLVPNKFSWTYDKRKRFFNQLSDAQKKALGYGKHFESDWDDLEEWEKNMLMDYDVYSDFNELGYQDWLKRDYEDKFGPKETGEGQARELMLYPYQTASAPVETTPDTPADGWDVASLDLPYDRSTPGHDFSSQYFYGADGGRPGYAGGGIADLRQGYFLGKLVKKATRAIKKVAKSPIGKAALGALAWKFGPQLLSGKGFGLGDTKKWGDLIWSGADKNVNLARMIGIPSLLGGAYTAMTEDDEEDDMYTKWLAEKNKWLAQFGDFPTTPVDPLYDRTLMAADGGRIGYGSGTAYPNPNRVAPEGNLKDNLLNYFTNKLAGREQTMPLRGGQIRQDDRGMGNLIPQSFQSLEFKLQNEYENYVASGGDLEYEAWKRSRGITAAQGGRIGYAGGYMVDDEEEELPHRTAALAAMYKKRMSAQEGGLMDLGGMEKDYRNDGGFVPIGGQERADDVPARLSKNEFVFTADAVRAAGGGDIDAGAEVMENLMENLEQGGQVSEESQGLEGARNMFATSQRLEGVL